MHKESWMKKSNVFEILLLILLLTHHFWRIFWRKTARHKAKTRIS